MARVTTVISNSNRQSDVMVIVIVIVTAMVTASINLWTITVTVPTQQHQECSAHELGCCLGITFKLS